MGATDTPPRPEGRPCLGAPPAAATVEVSSPSCTHCLPWGHCVPPPGRVGWQPERLLVQVPGTALRTVVGESSQSSAPCRGRGEGQVCVHAVRAVQGLRLRNMRVRQVWPRHMGGLPGLWAVDNGGQCKKGYVGRCSPGRNGGLPLERSPPGQQTGSGHSTGGSAGLPHDLVTFGE